MGTERMNEWSILFSAPFNIERDLKNIKLNLRNPCRNFILFYLHNYSRKKYIKPYLHDFQCLQLSALV